LPLFVILVSVSAMSSNGLSSSFGAIISVNNVEII
jgi:hypothetical protein